VDYPEDRLAELIATAVGAADLRPRIERTSAFSFAAQIADRYRNQRGFIVGDAAHRMTPRGGTGMNTAIHDAYDLGWKLGWFLRGWAGPELVESYEAERRPVGLHNVLRSADREGANPPGRRGVALGPERTGYPPLVPTRRLHHLDARLAWRRVHPAFQSEGPWLGTRSAEPRHPGPSCQARNGRGGRARHRGPAGRRGAPTTRRPAPTRPAEPHRSAQPSHPIIPSLSPRLVPVIVSGGDHAGRRRWLGLHCAHFILESAVLLVGQEVGVPPGYPENRCLAGPQVGARTIRLELGRSAHVARSSRDLSPRDEKQRKATRTCSDPLINPGEDQ